MFTKVIWQIVDSGMCAVVRLYPLSSIGVTSRAWHFIRNRVQRGIASTAAPPSRNFIRHAAMTKNVVRARARAHERPPGAGPRRAEARTAQHTPKRRAHAAKHPLRSSGSDTNWSDRILHAFEADRKPMWARCTTAAQTWRLIKSDQSFPSTADLEKDHAAAKNTPTQMILVHRNASAGR